MGVIQIDQLNYEHGGNAHPHAHRGDTHGYGYDYTGLARAFEDGEPPDILIMCEGDRADENGGEAGWEAARVLREATGRAYVPLFASLPDQAGPFAPVVFVDPQTIEIRRWYYHRLPDFAERNRNQLVCTPPGGDQELEVIAIHWDAADPAARMKGARNLVRGARHNVRRIALGDFNCTPSGKRWEGGDFNVPGHLTPTSRWAKALHRPGPAHAGPYQEDTRPLDSVLGWWDEDTGERVGGSGWFDVAEMAGDYTPTQYEIPGGRAPRAIDRILVSAALADAVLPETYTVHEAPAGRRFSDHKRISVRLRF